MYWDLTYIECGTSTYLYWSYMVGQIWVVNDVSTRKIEWHLWSPMLKWFPVWDHHVEHMWWSQRTGDIMWVCLEIAIAPSRYVRCCSICSWDFEVVQTNAHGSWQPGRRSWQQPRTATSFAHFCRQGSRFVGFNFEPTNMRMYYRQIHWFIIIFRIKWQFCGHTPYTPFSDALM